MVIHSSECKKPVIAVVGPTATGKTGLGIVLASHLESEVVSADSRVVYRELDIGTAKPTLDERSGIPHHLIDVANPDEVYSAARYQREATEVLEEMWKEGKIPIVVGGTGFYVRALLQEQFIPPVPPDESFRQAMQNLAEQEGTSILYERLQSLDPERASVLHPNDRFRLIRALEIIHHTGKPVPKVPQNIDYQVLWVGLSYEDRDALRALIDQRIQDMLVAGWLDEVEMLLERYGPEAEALRVTHGYPELVQVIQGRCSLDNAIEQIQINIHQYARRQMTWFRRNQAIQWYNWDDFASKEQLYCRVSQDLAKILGSREY